MMRSGLQLTRSVTRLWRLKPEALPTRSLFLRWCGESDFSAVLCLTGFGLGKIGEEALPPCHNVIFRKVLVHF